MISGNLNALLRKFLFLGIYQYWYTIYPYWYTLYQYWYNDTNIGINIPKSGKSILILAFLSEPQQKFVYDGRGNEVTCSSDACTF